MISVNSHIFYLLMRHDCVVIPGLGAFVAQNEPARFDLGSNRLIPPCRQVGFNCGLKHDDGLLTSSIARREGMSYESARAIVANEVAMLQSRISSSGFALLPGIGQLTRQGGALVYEPDSRLLDIVGWRFLGLEPLALEAVRESEPAVTVGEEPESENRILHVDLTRRAGRWMRIAASVALLVGLGFTLSTPIAVDRSQLQYASLTGPEIKGAHAIELKQETDTCRTLYCLRPDSAEATAVYKPVAAVVTPEMVKKEDASLYQPRFDHYLIVASCESRARALRYIARHPGQGLGLVEADGRFRVYIAASDDVAAVESQRTDDLTSRYPGAWIYSR